MTEPLRRAGRGTDATGATVVWTVAEGVRGRRWREARTRDGTILTSLLFETDPERRFSHIELATPAGLLTLHPEGDGTLHGNTVGPDGVRHIVGLPWSSDGVLLVEDSPITGAAAAWSAMNRVAGPPLAGSIVRIEADLSLVIDQADLAFSGAASADGLPILTDGEEWPLEATSGG